MNRIKAWLMLAVALLAVLLAVGVTTDDPRDATIADLYAAGVSALEAGQWDQAIALIQEICELQPGNRDAEEKLAQALDSSMVLVPAGDFLMGSDTVDMDERPQRPVFLDAFAIDQYEVTNIQYRRFLLAAGHEPPQSLPGRYVALLPARDPTWHGTEYPDGETMHPVVGVNWEDAVAYCAWAGKRLPTEAEWEKAARGADGRTYPWGDEWDPRKANVGETGVDYTQPVGSYPGGGQPLRRAGYGGQRFGVGERPVRPAVFHLRPGPQPARASVRHGRTHPARRGLGFAARPRAGQLSQCHALFRPQLPCRFPLCAQCWSAATGVPQRLKPGEVRNE